MQKFPQKSVFKCDFCFWGEWDPREKIINKFLLISIERNLSQRALNCEQ